MEKQINKCFNPCGIIEMKVKCMNEVLSKKNLRETSRPRVLVASLV